MLLLGLVVVGAVVAVGVGAALWFGGRKATSKVMDNYARQNQVVPGVESAAPTSWLGSHDPEAKLHRRLIDAIKALHTTQAFDTMGTYLDLRVDLEQAAVATDNELVATSTLPQNLRVEPLTRLTAAVASIEESVAEIGRATAQGAAGDIDAVRRKVRERTSSLGQAQAALDELERTDPSVAPQAQAPSPPPQAQTYPPAPPAPSPIAGPDDQGQTEPQPPAGPF
jgi:hypothetical protein